MTGAKCVVGYLSQVHTFQCVIDKVAGTRTHPGFWPVLGQMVLRIAPILGQ